ncbi:phosphotransferase [Dyella humi]|uniref:Phosphotransferase n=1 Tax=Dyella humi TaxID=1770547 RepID=A0ABW8ILY5_9GAMM
MLSQEAWAASIPHAGAMALLDAVVVWDETTIHAIGERYRPGEHPLRSAAGLHAVHLAEYGAQATAVHGALLGETKMQAGRLVSLRDVQLAVEYVDLSNGHLDVRAERLFADERGTQYAFKVEQQGQQLASGRVAVMYT